MQPHVADRGDRLVLKASWCKGGREREIPIRTERQRQVLDQAHRLVGRGSMIPSGRSYVEQVKLYERQTAAAGPAQVARLAACVCAGALQGTGRGGRRRRRAGNLRHG